MLRDYRLPIHKARRRRHPSTTVSVPDSPHIPRIVDIGENGRHCFSQSCFQPIGIRAYRALMQSPSNPGMEAEYTSIDLCHHFPTGLAGNGVELLGTEIQVGSSPQSSKGRKLADSKGVTANWCEVRSTGGNTGDGTRTHDLRIMRPPL